MGNFLFQVLRKIFVNKTLFHFQHTASRCTLLINLHHSRRLMWPNSACPLCLRRRSKSDWRTKGLARRSRLQVFILLWQTVQGLLCIFTDVLNPHLQHLGQPHYFFMFTLKGNCSRLKHSLLPLSAAAFPVKVWEFPVCMWLCKAVWLNSRRSMT